MPNARRILIVDDDAELSAALVEQLALHEEFEAEAVDTAAKGLQAAKMGARPCASCARTASRPRSSC